MGVCSRCVLSGSKANSVIERLDLFTFGTWHYSSWLLGKLQWLTGEWVLVSFAAGPEAQCSGHHYSDLGD